MGKKTFFLTIFLVFLGSAVWGASFLEEGEKLFVDNKPTEAKPLLEEALNVEPMNWRIYLYLGIIYEQLNQQDNSLKILQKGVRIAADDIKPLFYLNMGNNLFTMGQNMLAEEMYTKAIAIDASQHESYLNRANSRLQQENYSGALTDYKQYLKLNPSTPQRPQIEEVIRLLSQAIEEKDRLAKEQAERDKNLQDLLDSLKNAEDNTKNLSAGTEKLEQNYEEEDILD